MINQHTAENRSILKDILVGAGFDDKKVKRAIGYPVPIGFALNSQQPSGGGGGGPVIDGATWRESEELIFFTPDDPRFFIESTGGGFTVNLSLLNFTPDTEVATATFEYDASTLEELIFFYLSSVGFSATITVLNSVGAQIDSLSLPPGDYGGSPLSPLAYHYSMPDGAATFTVTSSDSNVSPLATLIYFLAVPKTASSTDGAFEVRIDGKPVPVMAKSEGQMLLSYNESSNILDPHKRLHIGSLVEVLSTVPWSMEFIYNTNQRFTKKGGATLEDADDPQPNGKFRLPVPPPWPQLDDGLEVDKTSS